MNLDLRSIFHKFTDKVKEAVQHVQGNNDKISLSALTSYIKKEANTSKTSRYLLGIDLHEYTLKEKDLQFILETRGPSADKEKVLSLTILNEGKPIFKYKSYDPMASPNMTISLPELAIN